MACSRLGELGHYRCFSGLVMELGSGEGVIEDGGGGCGRGVVFLGVSHPPWVKWHRLTLLIHSPSLPPPPPNSTHSIHAALTRASGPSLGTLCISALLLTLLRFLTLLLLALDRLPSLLLAAPLASYGAPAAGAALAGGVARWVVPGVGWIHRWVDGWKARVSRYVLVYCGMTGTGFWEGAGRSGALVSGKEVPEERVDGEDGEHPQGRGRSRRAGRRAGVDFGSERTLCFFVYFAHIITNHFGLASLVLLTIAPLTLTLPFALLTYLFVAHTLGAPHEALGAALLAAGTTGMVGVFCVGLVRDW